MSLPAVVLQLATQEQPNQGARRVALVVGIVLYAALMILSLALAARDARLQTRGHAGAWLWLLAIVAPEVSVCLHGVVSSTVGSPFLTGTPLGL